MAIGYLTNRSLDDVVATSFRCLDLNGDGFVSKGGILLFFPPCNFHLCDFSAAEMRAVCLTNFKMKKWIDVHKKAVGWDKIQITPAETAAVNREADEIFVRLDINKV